MLYVQRAANAQARLGHDMGIDLRGAHIAVAEQLLHGANVGSRLQQVSREAVPQRMSSGGLADFGQLNSTFHCPL